MRTIYKFPISVGITPINLTDGSQVFAAKKDAGGTPCIWATIDTEKPQTKVRKIYMTGTGWDLEGANLEDGEHLRFIDTIVMEEYGLVWHVFEVVR